MRDVFIEPAQDVAAYPPLDQAQHGMVVAQTGDQLAASLLKCGDLDADTEKVVMRKVLWNFHREHASLDDCWTRGVDPAGSVYVATPHDVPDPAPPRRDDAGDAGVAGMDFLSDMTSSMRSRSSARASVWPSPSEQAVPLSILDAAGDEHDELAAALAEAFDDEAFGQELFGLVSENDAQVQAEERELALDESNIVDSEAPNPVEIAVDEPVVETRWSNMKEESPDSHKYVSLATGAAIGRIHFIRGNAKATCRAHPRCACYVTTPRETPVAQVVADLQQWLDNFGCSEDEHWRQATRLKRDKYGMRVRA